jgi:hypothetical protein
MKYGNGERDEGGASALRLVPAAASVTGIAETAIH